MSKKRSNLRFTDAAEDDLSEIWRYIAERSPEHADRLIGELHRISLLIAENPLIGTPRGELISGVRFFPHNNYNIYYFTFEDMVEVYRVLHSSRNAVQIFEGDIDQPN